MKFMFNKDNKDGKLVLVDLKEYEKLERLRIESDLRFYEEKSLLKLEQKEFELFKKLETVNELDIDNSRHKFLESEKELNEEILKLKEEAQELELKNKLATDRAKLGNELIDQTVELKNTEINLLKNNHIEALHDKNEIIELLKTQVEVLTAKLTEIKISDAHIHVETVVAKK